MAKKQNSMKKHNIRGSNDNTSHGLILLRMCTTVQKDREPCSLRNEVAVQLKKVTPFKINNLIFNFFLKYCY